MALINCPECGKQISDQAASCPNCGMPRQKTVNASLSTTPKKQEVIRCPKCYSTNLHVDKKGFSGGKAFVGAITVGNLGLLAGTIGSNDILITCLKCGHKFNPVKDAKRKRDQEAQERMSKENPQEWLLPLYVVPLLFSCYLFPGFLYGGPYLCF